MARRSNYYKELTADYSRPSAVPEDVGQKLVSEFERYMALREPQLPDITPDYNLEQIEQENKAWWPARCEAIRQAKWDLLANESADDFTYLCQDGPFHGKTDGADVVGGWGAILLQQGATLIWPVVMFRGEVIFFEWASIDSETNEMIASGNVTFLRRGHRGGCYIKTEHLNFYRDVSASPRLMS